MGRSKFPGKPSKSINRKRISVLQLEDEANQAAESQQPPAESQQPSGSGSGSPAAREKGNNCDNDEDDNAPGGATISGNTASSSSATSSSGNSGNGSSSGSGSGSSGSGSTNGGGVNGGTHHKSAANLDKEAVTKDHNRDSDKPKAAASRLGALPNESATSVKSSAGTSGKLSGKSSKTYSGAFSATSSGRSSGSSPDAYSAASSDGASSGISSGKSTGTTAVKSSEASSTASTGISCGKPAGTTTAKTAATGTCSSGKSSKASSGTTCEATTSGLTSAASLKALSVATPATSTGLASALASPGGSSPGGAFAISAALLRARKNSNKKFKNLNLARGEIMLPSTSKLKQLNCPVVDSPTTTTNASASGTPPSTEGIPSIGGVASPGEDVSLKRVLSEMPNEVASEAASSICPAATNGATQGKGAASTGTPAAGASDGGSSPKSGSDEGPSTASTAAKQKKTVTFRNVLETSDDKSVVKRSYNPDIRIPIVSIMKKDSMNRPPNYSRGGECIVRPSILSKILNKNSNIDKLNSLKFRSVPASSASLNQESGSVSGSSPNVFGLSRAFGAPMDEDDEGGVTFRRNNSTEDQNNEEDEEMDEDEDDEEVEEEEENEPEDNDEAASEKSAETEKSTGSEERDPEEKQLVMDSRFVLPKRSTRSSRIIKPNKRLLEEGAISSRKPTSSGDSKAKNLFSATSSSLVASASTSSSSGCLKLAKESFCSFGSLKTNTSSGESFVLRPPRLQFQTESKQGPFTGGKACPTSPSAIPTPVNSLAVSSFATLASPNTSSTSGTTTPSVCSVCSATVSSKEVAQARKYAVVACDVCRKFISKMTKKSISATSSSANASSVSQHQLQCKGSEGSTCSIHSAKGQLKNSKKFYKDRCTACWLKKCMISFQLPAAHRSRLSAILPPGMRGEASSREDKSAELLSPTANLRFTASASSISSSVVASTSVKWKSSSDSTSALTSIKSNPLAENNVTFGSTPLLRPAILEKPLFLKISNAADQKLTSTEGISPSSSRKTNKQEKEKTKEQEQSDKPLSPTVAATKKSAVVELVIEAPMEEAPQTSLTAATVAHTATSNGTSQSVSQPEANGETNGTGDTLKRQRIDLKGPRVKHVCRSASIVLGQPLATFGEDQQPEEEAEVLQEVATPVPSAISEPTPDKPTQMVTDENDNCASCKTPPPAKETKPFKFSGTNQAETKKPTAAGKEGPASTAPLVAAPAKVTTRNAAVTSNLIVAASKKQRNGDIVTSSSVTQSSSQTQGRRVKEQRQPRTLISIDFWENYDPAEVCQTGFGLIVTETVAQRALCFLCGSTGLDPLIFCACCCEPYHQYCVQDEYNLKHGSFEDTTLMGSLLETTVNATGPSSSSLNQLTQRLNWLCPRCTVCYTCNMSSGSKVKCQKCQKNYHSTCLGTSKRLLGADRPLICVNCLKCKSCSTTKVSKFVGNLPMCTGCFKLRKKGNFCPICQRCYDDNDFDLKMMECGDCSQWVHSKCEGLSDEQYNLLSTLPESIEFICKKCARRNESSRIKAEEWRQAVMEEFKASLYSVLKLLSKSRQACALLKLSPRKKMRCTCGASTNQGKLQPKALQFSSGSDNGLGSDGESQNSDDVYEFKEQQQQQRNLNMNKSRVKSLSCSCQQHISHSHSFSLVDIKQKIAGNSYVSLAEFNYDMSQVIQQSNCDELDIAYKELLSEQFPWFQNETKACTDALEEDMFESCSGTNYEDLQDGGGGSSSVYNEHTTSQAESRSGVLDIPLEEVDDLGSCGIKMRLDTRVCLFCRKSGEGLSGEEARLLYCGHDCWVHTNCAMWSAEVFEEIDGSLQNVHSAVSRGRMIKCTVCGNRGATVGCNVRSCGEHYHYPCARSIDCAFLTDKSMYCPAHAKNGNALKANGSASVTYESNFEVSRPVYVELDRKRKKLIEPARVQFHIGSLEVRQLGTIVPRFSDSYEAVVPINFLCSRLYWSSKEPWKIVEYTVRTTIQNSLSTLTALDVGRNYTVDHTNPNGKEVQLGLAQIARWHTSLARSDFLENGGTDWSGDYPNPNSCVLPDENTEEEPQQQADLFPPEIKDAIFEDLPHELLDGISMLDIFMYEDLADKTDPFAISEQSKDGTQAMTSNQGQSQNQQAGGAGSVSICDEDTRNSNTSLGNGWPASNPVEDAMLSAARNSSQVQMLKTLAWPKLDGNSAMATAIKRRKLSKNLAEGVLLTLSSQQRSKKEMATVAGVSRRQSISEAATEGIATTSGSVRSKSFTWSAAKRFYEKSEAREEPTKMRIMQMDGVDDSITEFRIIAGDGNLSTAQFTGQVKCDRCQCTYRNYDAFQRHVPSCAPSMSTNESESDVNAAGSTNNTAQLSAESLNELQKQLLANAGGLNYLQTAASFPQVQSLGSLGQFGLQGLQQLQLQPQSLGNGFFLSQPNPTTQANTDELQIYANSLQSLAANLGGGFTLAQPTVTAPAQPQLIAVSTNPDGTQQFIQIPQTMQATTTTPTATYQTLQATNTDKKIMLPLTAAGKPLKTVATKAAQQAAAKQRQLKSAHQVKPIQAKLQPHPQQHQQQQQPQVQQPITVMGQNLLQPQLLFQSSAQSQAPQLILPQAQPQNIISFVTGDGSQGQPLQYISIPTAGDYKPQPQPTATPTFLTTAPGGGATYLQTDASGNLVLTTTPTNSGLQMLTAQSLQAQPQVIGTLIQPQTIQLGGGSDGNQAGSNQQPLILGGTGGGATGLEFATTTPQVILATQPMYYGLETIVQNTVMSSQQFVSTAMPGMLSQNASFSATTTQVFQASKIEPIVDLPAGYVVLNNAGDATTTGTFLNAASVLQQQSQDDATTQLLQNANFQFQTVPTSSGASTSMDYSSPVMVTAKIPPVTQIKRTNAQAKAAGISGVGKVPPQPQVVNKVLPTSIVTQQSQVQLKNSNLKQSQLKGKAASGTGTNCGAPPSIASKPLQKKTNMIRPIHKLEVKPKVMKPTPKMQQQSQAMLQQQQQQQPQLHQQIPAVVVNQVPKVTISQQRIPAQPQQQLQQTQLLHIPQQQQQQQLQQPQVQVQPSMPIITIADAPVMQPQFVMEPQVLEQQEMANRVQHFSTSSSSSSSNCSLPTNVVNPMQQQATPTSSSSTTRPTNRVLPMQQRQEPAPLSNECPVAPSPTPPKPVEQPVIQQMNSASASKCYAQKTALPSPVYEAELKTSSALESMLPVTTMEAIMEEQPATESIYTEGLYEKHSPAEAKTEQLLLQQQQREQLNQQLASNGYLLDKHTFQVEPMETDVYGGEDLEEEDEEDDDFSLKMATSACNEHEMSDSEEPAVKDKISKILDNLTNDDCADSIATATTMEVDAGAGYQQMVEDVLATTAAASAPTEEFEGTLETAAVEAAATYINEMADAHVLELKQLQNGVELELRRRKEEQRTAPQEQEPSKTVVMPTASAPEPPPPIRESKKISGPHLLYEIQSEDGFTYKSSSISEIWEKVFEAVQVARRAHGLTPLPEGPLADMGGIQMIGLKTNALKYLIEQLPGVEKCSKYTPKYHKRNGNVSTAASAGHVGNIGGSSASGILAAVSGGDAQGLLDYGSDQDELQENAFDCARCEPYANRSEYDMFSWLASRHRKQPIQVFVQPSDNELVPRRGTGSNLPMAMKYRTLKETYKDYVGVFRSHIHGRGLYCTKDIEAGEMVIEYAGELIRSTLTDKRERYYDSRGIGCYMFKIDDNLVVDATMRGNAARFINHSCEPNCYSKVVDILGHKHIIIFALRRIVQGEELTYDYKFPFEEEKIPCSCGSKRCRKYLN